MRQSPFEAKKVLYIIYVIAQLDAPRFCKDSALIFWYVISSAPCPAQEVFSSVLNFIFGPQKATLSKELQP